MARVDRLGIIDQIERARNSRLICYLTGDRPGMEARIGMDIFPYFYDALIKMGKQQQIDLFIYSAGGATMAAWGLVNLLREFCGRFCVLVPSKAQSSATLISLGADEIVMSRMGQLSPVDPSTNSPFNPVLPVQIPGTQPQFLPVSVEDVTSYVELAKEVGIKDEQYLSTVFGTLSGDVRPLALGNVHRAKQQIKMLSEKLLAFHMKEKDRIDAIVSTLTRELYSHDYLIGKTEAKHQIGLKIADISDVEEAMLVTLLKEYSDSMLLQTPYNADVILGTDSTKAVTLDSAFIESTDATYAFRTKKELKRIKTTQQGLPVEGVQERILQQGWVLEKPEKAKSA
jgi:serine dehydrogenase proteinase